MEITQVKPNGYVFSVNGAKKQSTLFVETNSTNVYVGIYRNAENFIAVELTELDDLIETLQKVKHETKHSH